MQQQQDERPSSLRQVEEEEYGKEFTVNDMVEHCGNGLYQVMLLFLCGICWLVDSMEIMLISFILPVLQQEWDLKGWQTGLVGSFVFVGMFIGASLFGWLSDKYGRRKALSIFVVYTGVTGAISAFSPNYICFMFTRFLTGIGCAGAHVPFSLFSEFLPTKGRAYYLLGIEVFWTIGAMVEAAMAWVILPKYTIHMGPLQFRSWRLLLLFTSFPLFFTILMLPIIPESPRYNMLRGKRRDALNTLKQMAKLNRASMLTGKLVKRKREEPEPVTSSLNNDVRSPRKQQQVANEEEQALQQPQQTTEIQSSQKHSSTSGIMLIFTRKYIMTTLALSVIWFVVSFAYYGVVVLTPDYFKAKGSSGDNQYREVFITSSAELPGVILAAVLINSVGRKLTIGITFLFCGVFLLTLMIPANIVLLTIFAVISRMTIMGAFSSVYVATPELYPTVARAFGVGFNSSVARIAGILTPFISSALFDVSPKIPVIIYGVSCLVGAVAVIFIRETNGKALADTEQDDTDANSKKQAITDVASTEQDDTLMNL